MWPGFDLGMHVGGVVVGDQMDRQVFGRFPVDFLEEARRDAKQLWVVIRGDQPDGRFMTGNCHHLPRPFQHRIPILGYKSAETKISGVQQQIPDIFSPKGWPTDAPEPVPDAPSRLCRPGVHAGPPDRRRNRCLA